MEKAWDSKVQCADMEFWVIFLIIFVNWHEILKRMNLMAVSHQNNILFIVTENKLSAFQIHNDGKIKDVANPKIYKISEDNV